MAIYLDDDERPEDTPALDDALGRFERHASVPEPEPRLHYVNAYEVTLAWGGREEGGWWYDVGTPLASLPVITEEDENVARAWLLRTLRPEFMALHRHPKSSTAADAADLEIVIENEPAAPYPTERPHYE